MLLIHDLVEIYAGDTFFLDKVGRTEAHDKEKLSMVQLLSILPDHQKNEIMILWEEFENYESEEAIFARTLDSLQPLLNHILTSKEKSNPKGILASKVLDKKKFIENGAPDLWPTVLTLIEESKEKELYY